MPVKLTRSDRERVTEQARDLWYDVFSMLDLQPELTSDDAAQVATAVETTYIDRMTALLGVTVTDEWARVYHDAPTPGTYLCGHPTDNGDIDLSCATCHREHWEDVHRSADSAPLFVLDPELTQ